MLDNYVDWGMIEMKMNQILDSNNLNIVTSKNFCCVQEGKHFWGVYELCPATKKLPVGVLLTSGKSLSSACKKMKLLQAGYDIRKDIDDYFYH